MVDTRADRGTLRDGVGSKVGALYEKMMRSGMKEEDICQQEFQ
jgi:hypothetical protein